MKKIKWGIIGCGDVTEVKSGPAFQKAPNSELVGVMRRDTAKAQDYAQRHGVPKWYDDAQKLLEDADVTAIYVATPPSTHEEYALRALKVGKPVYVEKPMTTDASSAERILKASVETGVKLSIAHYRREQPRFKKMKALIDSGEIGDVRLVMLQCIEPPRVSNLENFWRVDPAVSGGGMFHDLAPHQLDIMLYFFGPYKQAQGSSFNSAKLYAADDLVIGNIVFENGVVFNGSWCFTAAPGETKDLIEIIGSKGTIRFAIFSTHDFTLIRNGAEEVFKFDDLLHVQQPMIEAVTAYFLGEAPNPSTAENALDTMRIIDAFTGK